MMEEIETNYYKVKEANDFKDDTDIIFDEIKEY